MWSSVQDEAQANRTCVGSQGKFNSNPKNVLGLTNFILLLIVENFSSKILDFDKCPIFYAQLRYTLYLYLTTKKGSGAEQICKIKSLIFL